MDRLEAYKIDLKALQGNEMALSLVADNEFFAAVQGPEIEQGAVNVDVLVKEAGDSFMVDFQFEGEVQVICDRCLEPMMIPVSGDSCTRVKFGEEYDDDGEVIVVPEKEGILDLSWLVYEQIALQIPIRHVHPEGECSAEMQKALSSHGASDSQGGADEGTSEQSDRIDPRWEALKKLISTNN